MPPGPPRFPSASASCQPLELCVQKPSPDQAAGDGEPAPCPLEGLGSVGSLVCRPFSSPLWAPTPSSVLAGILPSFPLVLRQGSFAYHVAGPPLPGNLTPAPHQSRLCFKLCGSRSPILTSSESQLPYCRHQLVPASPWWLNLRTATSCRPPPGGHPPTFWVTKPFLL